MRALLAFALLAACERPDWNNQQSPSSAPAAAPSTPAPPVTPEPVATLRYGDKVQAQWKNGKWYSGTLTAVYSDGTADVRYDDGDRSKGLPFAKIKLVKRPLFEAADTSK